MVPRPGTDSTATCPPLWVTTPYTVESPSPVPSPSPFVVMKG